MAAATQAQAGSVGAGQQEPDDATSEFAKIAFICRSILHELDTMQPCQVVAVHPGSGTPPIAGTVDVQLLVSQLDGDGNPTQQGVVTGLPYFRLQGSGWQIIADPAVNEFGYVLAAQRDISSVVAAPGIANPGSFRSYSVADGIYVGGALNPAPAQYIWLKPDGTFVISDGKGNVLSTSANGFSLTGNLAVTGSITATQNILAGSGTPGAGLTQVSLYNHLHTANNTAPTHGT